MCEEGTRGVAKKRTLPSSVGFTTMLVKKENLTISFKDRMKGLGFKFEKKNLRNKKIG